MTSRHARGGRSATSRLVAATACTVLVVLCLLSCGGEQREPLTQPRFPAGGQQQSQTASRFLKELKKHDYPETAAPAEAPVFRWDFSGKAVHRYTYEQEMTAKTSMAMISKTPTDMQQAITAKGQLLIKSQGDRTAHLFLKDVRMISKMKLGKGQEKGTMEQKAPPLFLQGMEEDGSAPYGDSSQELLLRILLPLPPKSLKVGESAVVPAQMPFNAMGSRLQVKGRLHITLTKYVKIGERTCAQFDTDIDISKLDVPPEMGEDYKYSCSAKGKSVFFFDIEERCFVLGTIALLMKLGVDAPTPTMNMPGVEPPADRAERSKMSMVTDILTRVTLRE